MNTTAAEPLLSIVVLTRNNHSELVDTLASIRSQITEAALQVIVVDGSDTPVPPATVTPYELVHDRPARGIYPAMNLGLAHCRGAWVQFLNSGDCLLHPNALQRLLDQAQAHHRANGSPARVVFGQALICPVPPSRCPPWLAPDLAMSSLRLWLRFYVPNHQSLLVAGDWARQHPYALNSPQSADRSWMAAALADLTRVVYLAEPVVRYNLGGISSQLPSWRVLRLRLQEPSRNPLAKAAEIVKFLLQPFASHYPRLMALRSRLIGWLV